MIQEQIELIRSELPEDVTLVAVSKFHPQNALQEAYDCGQRIFGESHVQELQVKQSVLPDDIEWHFIGHLQTNKVKYIAPYISLIHAVDTYKLLEEINRQGKKNGRIIPCLLQLHVAQEETKFGFFPDECLDMLDCGAWQALDYVRIRGIMCMASNVDDNRRIHKEFKTAYDFYEHVKNTYFASSPAFSIRSWGMSDDYKIAVQEGSNMVRVGSRIFGKRQY